MAWAEPLLLNERERAVEARRLVESPPRLTERGGDASCRSAARLDDRSRAATTLAERIKGSRRPLW